ncbi:hypothetical protein J1N35_007154 [Gossypium stocksii]|uniref:Uncharacterized protein n=1 Tax=Gossypium stocksii TaxID=47602 RepID=A0A9D4AFB5_9ROSI|nr:hypothetical protein J1N35_007154 [Gossypium stocksii]
MEVVGSGLSRAFKSRPVGKPQKGQARSFESNFELSDIVSGVNKKGLEKQIGLGDLKSLVSSKTVTAYESERSRLQQKILSSDSHDAIPPKDLNATHPSTSSVKDVARPSNVENSFVNVEVKEGVLEAENHPTIIFNNIRSQEVEDEVPRGSYSAGGNHSKGGWKNQIAKRADSKGGWKLNKTLKGPGNRFKMSENSRVPFADFMKKAVNLISFEIEEQSAKDLTRHLEEKVVISFSDCQ